MIRINELKLPLDEDEKELYRLAAKALKIGERHIRELIGGLSKKRRY